MPEITSTIPSSEAETAIDNPSISVDRALGHLFPEFAIDTEALNSFYNSLPHNNKLPLSNLLIHFSASPVSHQAGHKEITTRGRILWYGTSDNKSTTPELPTTTQPTIIIYLGSALKKQDAGPTIQDANDFGDRVSQTLRHELTHYAQGPRYPLGKLSRFNKIKRSAIDVGTTALFGLIIDSAWTKAGTAALAASEIFTDSSLPTSVKLAAATATLTHFANRKKRRESLAVVDHSDYLKDDRELDARVYEKALIKIVEIGPSLSVGDIGLLKSITISEDKGRHASRYIAREVHKDLSLKSAKH